MTHRTFLTIFHERSDSYHLFNEHTINSKMIFINSQISNFPSIHRIHKWFGHILVSRKSWIEYKLQISNDTSFTKIRNVFTLYIYVYIIIYVPDTEYYHQYNTLNGLLLRLVMLLLR